MSRFDPDTIAALAEGQLDPEQASDLERAIVADPAASAELAAHRIALAAAKAAPAPSLSITERADLRSAVAAALGVEHAAHQPSAPQRRRVPWAAISMAAAALVALVAIAPLSSLLSAGDESATAPALGAFDQYASTVAPSPSTEFGKPADEPTAAETTAVTDLAGAATTTIAASAGTERTTLGDDETRSRLTAAFDTTTAADAVAPAEDTPCLTEGLSYLGDVPLIGTSFTTEDGATVVAFYLVGDDGTVTAAVGFDPADCSIRVTYP